MYYISNIYSFIKRYIFNIIVVLLIIISYILNAYLIFSNMNSNVEKKEVDDTIAYTYVEEEKDDEDVINTVLVDIKGAINKPGVYEIDSNSIINDVIKAAGGLKSNATTNNINLSKKVSNEMVIYVSTKQELSNNSITNVELPKDTKEIIGNTKTIENNASIEIKKDNKTNESDNNTSKLININTAGVSELISIPGIGEAKANSIISYRKEKGLFKSIEDIKEVSGIGTSLYEKIKEYITI